MTAIITKQNAKDKAFIGGGGGSSDYPTDATFDTIKVNKEATFTVNNENITFANHESRIKTLEQSGGGGSSDSLFTSYSGFDYFAVKNENITTGNADYWSKSYYYLAITVPDSIVNKLKNSTESIQVFNIIIRERVFYTINAECITQFNISYQNNKFMCPVITLLNTEDNHNVCSFDYKESPLSNGLPAIFIHDDLHISPHSLYINGDMSIVYLLNQSGIQSIAKEIKCDIIDAKNCFKLHESDVPYLYKPKYFKERITTEGTEKLPGGAANKILESIGNYWTCIWEFDDSQHFVNGQTFKFEEYCFNNVFSFIWNESKQSWVGANVQCIQKQSVANLFDGSRAYCIAIERSVENYNLVNLLARYTTDDENLIKSLNDNGNIKWTVHWGDNNVSLEEAGLEHKGNYPHYDTKFKPTGSDKVYDMLFLDLQWKNYNKAFRFEYLLVEITINDVTNKLVYYYSDTTPTAHEIVFNIQSNTIVTLGGAYTNTLSNSTHNNKNIELHLFKEFIRKRDEINWDGVTNPFIYIIDRQFYKITPNPVSATTLYTDFNITSSKVITADNITTMRSDLNVVSNNVDVVSWDVEKLRSDFETFAEQVENELNKTEPLDIIDGILTVVDGGFAVGGLINFFRKGGLKNIMKFFGRTEVQAVADLESDLSDEVHTVIDDISEVIDPREEPIFGMTNADTFNWTTALAQLNKYIAWGNSAKSYLTFDTKYENVHPSNSLLTFGTALEISHQIRNTLKPVIVDLANDVIENHNEINAITTNYVTPYDFINRVNETPVISCIHSNQRMWFSFKNYIDEGEITFNVYWCASESDFDLNVKLSFVSIKDEMTHKRIGYKVTEFSCPAYTDRELRNRYKEPVIQNCQHDWDNFVCEIVIDAVLHPDSEIMGDDMFDKVELVSSNVMTYKDSTSFNDIVYKDDVKSLNEKVDKLINGNLTANADIERRIAILEAKCKNIVLQDEPTVQTATLSLEERLQILERKCANINI